MTVNTEELISIQKKREAIEKLIAFAQQLSRITHSMESVQQIIRPSQIPKKRRFALLHQLIERLQTAETHLLTKRLKALDSAVEKEIKTIVSLSKLTENDFHEKYATFTRDELMNAHQLLLKELRDFSRKAQTNVAIRFTLHGRGYPLASARLPISQEKLGEQVEQLKSQENESKQKISDQIESLIKDTDIILDNTQASDSLKSEALLIKGELQNHLELLQQGKDIGEIPVFIETLEIQPAGPAALIVPESNLTDDEQDNESKQPKVTSEPSPSRDTSALENLRIEYSQKSFFGRFWMWLNTPLGVSWSAIKEQTRETSTDNNKNAQ